jgi:hypothetical protein
LTRFLQVRVHGVGFFTMHSADGKGTGTCELTRLCECKITRGCAGIKCFSYAVCDLFEFVHVYIQKTLKDL